MTTINFGNIVGNRVIGLSSGLDTETIISELTSIRQQPIDTLNDKITLNASKATQFSNLSTLLNSLKTTANYLRHPFGIGSRFSNIFEYRSVNLSSATLTASSYLNVTADPGALKGTSSIEIGQLAAALEQRSAAFTSRDTDATTAATGAYFTPGTFQIGSGIVNEVDGDTLSTFELGSSDYAKEGTLSGVLANSLSFNVVGGDGGKTTLQGAVSGFTGVLGGSTATFSVSIGGTTYTSNAVDVTQVTNVSHAGIQSGTAITFTADSGGLNETSFTITTASDIDIDATQANVNTFATNLDTAFDGVEIYQSRRIENFTDANVKSPLTGLTNSNIRFYSDSFGTDGTFGEISGFTVQHSTGSDGVISVTINGETYRASGLGTTLNANITLQSTTTDKELRLNFGDAGISVAFSSEANGVSLERALDYAFGTRELVDITVASGDTLNDVVYAINSNAASTGLSASVLQISDFDFRFDLKANSEGIDNKYEIFDASNVLTTAALSTVTSAQDAEIRVDGIEITRSTNTITDVIENVTLELLAITPDYDELVPDTISIDIDNDVDTVVAGVVSFLDAFNALRVFSTEQNQRDDVTGEYTEDAILGGNTVLSTLANQLISEINTVVSNTTDTDFDSFSDLGITLSDFAGDGETVETKNILTYDETELRNLLSANYDKLREIFEFSFTADSADIAVFKTSNNFTLNDFKLDIDTGAAVGEQVQLLNADGTPYLDDGDPVYLDYSNGKITGQAGTAVDGLEFIYTGDGTDVIAINISQGIGDRIYNLVESYVEDAGIIDDTVQGFSDQNDDYETEILRLQDLLDDYTERLQAQFAALEQAISSVNNVLLLLDANTAAANAKQ